MFDAALHLHSGSAKAAQLCCFAHCPYLLPVYVAHSYLYMVPRYLHTRNGSPNRIRQF